MAKSLSTNNDSERVRRLMAERDRVTAEMKAVEDGTLPFIEERRHVTAELLADAFGLSLPAANNRLARLLKVGLLDREPVINGKAGGRAYRYRRVG